METLNIEQRHAQMVRQLVKDPAQLLKEMDAQKMAAIHAALGIAGEAGELACLDNLKDHLLEEGGDMLFYCRDLRHAVGCTDYAYARQAGPDLLWPRVGDVVDLVKKWVIYGGDLGAVRIQDIGLALDQIESLVEDMLTANGYTREQALECNLQKLLVGPRARYAGGYSDAAAAARADKQFAEERPLSEEPYEVKLHPITTPEFTCRAGVGGLTAVDLTRLLADIRRLNTADEQLGRLAEAGQQHTTQALNVLPEGVTARVIATDGQITIGPKGATIDRNELLKLYGECQISRGVAYAGLGIADDPAASRSPDEWRPTDPWQDHPQHDRSDWMMDAAKGDTCLGYIDWVNHRIEADEAQ